VMILLVALIIAVALEPVVRGLEQRRWPRWVAAGSIVLAILATLVLFVGATWSSLTNQVTDLTAQVKTLEREVEGRAPEALVQLIRQSSAVDVSTLGPYLLAFGRSVMAAMTAFVLAWVLVFYLLIEREPTYRWIRGFVPERLRARFDRTAAEASEAARGYVIGNVISSVCAGIYFYVWLSVLGVPAALLLALVAFVADFIPVVGFLLSVVPAMAMAATESVTVALAIIPIALAYDALENYLIAPHVYGHRLRLSNLAVLLALAVGAQLGGVLGALLALPVAAVYPTIERLWLRQVLGDDVVDEHAAIAGESGRTS
jgi:predicted PurR-regulated permease PerM